MELHPRAGVAKLLIAATAALSMLACGALLPPVGAAVTPTPTGQIGAIEAETPELKGNHKDFQVWTGTITSKTSRRYFSNGTLVNTCLTDWITEIDLAVDAVGDVRGTGKATLSGPRSCSPQSNLVENTSEMDLSASGRKDNTAFHLAFSMLSVTPMPSGEFGGYDLLLSDGKCPPTAASSTIPLTSGTAAQASLSLRGVPTGCGGSTDDIMTSDSLVNLEYRFKCSDLPADMNDPALEALCQ
jgi:hypothetical protein